MSKRSLIGAMTVATATALLLLLGGAAWAEQTLSLDQALDLARAHNRDLRAARARLEQSAANVELAWVALLPQVTAQGKYTRNYKEVAVDLSAATRPLFGLAEIIKNTSRNPVQNAAINSFEQQAAAMGNMQPVPIINKLDQLDFALNANVPLLVPYAYPALSSAKHAHASDVANFSVTEATLLYSVAQAYFAAAGADELVLARRHAVAVAQETFDEAKARFDAGVVNRVETTRAEVALVRAEQAAAETGDVAAQAYRALGTLLGTHEPFRVTPSPLPPVAEAAPAVLVAEALELRPEVVVLKRAIDSNVAGVRSAWWRWAPALSAFGNFRAFNYAGFSGDNYSWAAGAQLDWLLYDGGTRDAQRHLAWAQRRENEARLELERETITDEVVNAQRTLGTKRRALDSARRSFELSEETLRLVRAQHDAGTARQLDLLQAQDSLVEAEVAQAQARFDLALADLLLRRTAGLFPPTATRSDR